ncbi:MAG: bifunctional UDP-N-acetylglucosamine diphosphorylase/glucosamine-1-phosphate N-acetyltransferase GlmU [Firmicutes bacterium]|nr:bifunctional UDP-N-acetylglucosamine diphosphorylase/glucosamine-1-phosphate N-acetyltransferase GlmU [Bacillota bacterium]
MKKTAAIILAAGKSKRMKTETPKVLHELMGKPVIEYVLSACAQAGVEDITLVIGHEKEKVRNYLKDRVKYAEQNQQLGTGHAVMQAMPCLENFEGDIMIVCGDMPLLGADTITNFVKLHQEKGAKVSLLTAIMEEPGKLGRIVRSSTGTVEAIVEAVDATPEQLAIREVNTGTYLFDAAYLREILPKIGLPNAQSELYLTDTIILSFKNGIEVQASTCKDEMESLGINSRKDLAIAAKAIKDRVNGKMMESGVTLYDPDNTYIEEGVEIGKDTTILPGCMILGKTVIGEQCIIGPNTRIHNSKINNGCLIQESVVIDSEVGETNQIGPFAHLRPATVTAASVKIGNFVETKKSVVGEGSKISHLSYVGDSTLGKKVNIGAGTITCNYDGVKKNPTVIKDGAFIGSNTNLIAPVTVGEGARTGAGAVVKKDVPDYTVAVGLPARNIRKLNK